MIETILLLKNGELGNTTVKKNINVDYLTDICYFKHHGIGKVKQLHYWELFDKTLILYGWDRGEIEQKNKHKLPEPINNSLYFGDLLLLCLDENGRLTKFTKLNYQQFLHQMELDIDQPTPNDLSQCKDPDLSDYEIINLFEKTDDHQGDNQNKMVGVCDNVNDNDNDNASDNDNDDDSDNDHDNDNDSDGDSDSDSDSDSDGDTEYQLSIENIEKFSDQMYQDYVDGQLTEEPPHNIN